jgi:hypothetical protein
MDHARRRHCAECFAVGVKCLGLTKTLVWIQGVISTSLEGSVPLAAESTIARRAAT